MVRISFWLECFSPAQNVKAVMNEGDKVICYIMQIRKGVSHSVGIARASFVVSQNQIFNQVKSIRFGKDFLSTQVILARLCF